MRRRPLARKARRRVRAPGKAAAPPKPQSERAQLRAELKRRHAVELARLDRTLAGRKQKAKYAVQKFKPKRKDRGKIIIIGVRGGRLPANNNRRGYAVYINSKGRKIPIRQHSKITGRLEKTAIPRRATSIDVSALRVKRAKKEFLVARTNPVAAGVLNRKGMGVSHKGTRYAGAISTDKFYAGASSVAALSRELVRAVNGTRSKKDFLVTIGLDVVDGLGKHHWISLERRFSRQDRQKAGLGDVQAFFGREIYAFLARELADRNLVLSGSARHIGMLKGNRGKPRHEWTKDGFLWQGHDMQNVRVEKLEYRFDQLTIGK